MRRSLGVVLATAATAVLVAAPTASGFAASTTPTATGSPPAHTKTTFTVGILQDPDSLNPFIGVLSSAYEIYQLCYDTLTGYSSKDFAPTPGLATSWSTSADGLTWTYKIRSGVKWSDGVPLTAHDVAYTFNRVIHGSFEQTNYGNYVANITSVTAPDDTTVVMKTKVPTPTMLKLAVYILPEHIWKNISEKQVQTFENDQNLVGSGPFVLEDRQVGQFVRLKANKNYWGGAPHIDTLVFRIFNNNDAMVQALRKGEIDIADDIPANLYNSLQGVKGITRVPAEYSGFDEIGINTGAATDQGVPIGNGNPALKDKRVRQAIAYAVDQQTLVQRVLLGYGEPGTTIIPPIYANTHYEPTAGERYSFNIAKANQILDQAGYTKGSDGVRRMPGTNKPLNLRLFGRQDSQSSQQVVKYVQGWLDQIGIKTTVSIVAENRLTEIIGNGEYDLFEWGWVVEPDPDYQLSTFTCGQRSSKDGGSLTAGLSDSFYCNKAYDALYAQQKDTVDPTARTAVVKQAEKMLYDDVPYVVTYYYDDLEAYRSDRWTGLVQQPEGKGSLIFQYGVYSYLNARPVSAQTSGGKTLAAATSNSSGSSVGIYVGVVVAVLVCAGIVVLVVRRRATVDERE